VVIPGETGVHLVSSSTPGYIVACVNGFVRSGNGALTATHSQISSHKSNLHCRTLTLAGFQQSVQRSRGRVSKNLFIRSSGSRDICHRTDASSHHFSQTPGEVHVFEEQAFEYLNEWPLSLISSRTFRSNMKSGASRRSHLAVRSSSRSSRCLRLSNQSSSVLRRER
jgi:hypothetical protein